MIKKLAASLLTSIILISTAYADFIDVVPQSLFYEAVQYFSYDFPIINLERESFKPLTPVTNAEFYKLILESAGFKGQQGKTEGIACADVNGDEWFASYTKKALDLNLTTCGGENNLFNPAANIIRSEGIKKIFQLYGLKGKTPQTPGYNDIPADNEIAAIAQTVYDLKLLSDYRSGYFSPDKLLTRAETINILYGIHQVIDNLPDIGETADYSDYSGYSVSSSDLASLDSYSIFIDVWEKLNTEYIENDKIDQEELLYGAISGMVDKLEDPYSVFLEPTDAVTYQESLDGAFEGIGIYLSEEDGNFIIVTPLKGSPAEKAGIKPGDIIIEIDGAPVSEMTLEDVILKLRGPAGTSITIKIKRGSSTLSIKIMREQIEVPYVESEMKDGYGIIHYYQFTGNSHDQFLVELDKIIKHNPKGLILDLRNNPGGYLTSSQDLISHFILKNQVFINITYADGSKETETSYGPGDLSKYPVVVLINEGTASASEIVALALRDVNKSKIVGAVSYGKGKIQEIITYGDNSSLKLSIAKWSSPNGTYIDKIGITPDYSVNITDQNIANSYDPQIEKAIDLLRNL